MNEWTTCCLGDICKKIVTGGTPLSSNQDFYKEGTIPWLKTKEVNFCSIESTENHISELGLEKSSAKLIPINCVIIAMYGQGDTAGRVAINKIPLATNQACCNLWVDENLADYYFVYSTLKNSYKRLVDAKTGSAQPNLNTGIIREFIIHLPPLKEQKAIAAVLSCLDRKIENLRKQNETLEAIAQTLFKRWFIDFEFPYDFTQGKPSPDGQPYKSSGGAMQPSELGEIPHDWKIVDMRDVVDVRDGTHDSPKQASEGFHLVTSKHLKKDGIDFQSTYLISEEDYIEVNKRSVVETCDILLSMIGTIGLLYFVSEEEINFAIKNIGLFKTSKNKEYAEFIFLFLSSSYGRSYFWTRRSGTTQSYLTLKSLREMSLIKPDEDSILMFHDLTFQIFRKIRFNNKNVLSLTKIRDNLLPKLMSSQLRITP